MKMHLWELANDTAMDSLKWPRTVPVRLESGTRDFDAFLIEQNFWFKQRKGHSIQFQLSEGKNCGFAATSISQNERRFFSDGSRNGWEDWFVTDCLRRREFARQFFFSDGQLRREDTVATERLLVWSGGKAAWSWHEQPDSQTDARFSWDDPMSAEEFLFWPALDVWEQIESQLADEGGEAAFARSFARLSEAERDSTVLSWRRGTPAKMREVLECLLVAHGMNQSNEIERLFLKNDRRLWGQFGSFSFLRDVSDELQRDIERVWRHFEPMNPRVQDFECVREYVKANLIPEEILVPPSSAHERMEALLRWRAWVEESGA